MRLTVLLFLLLPAGAPLAAGESRLSGSAALAPAAPVSADGRFSLNAELGRGDTEQRTGRFALTADLTASADAKNTTTACAVAGVLLFNNGFEN